MSEFTRTIAALCLGALIVLAGMLVVRLLDGGSRQPSTIYVRIPWPWENL